MSRETLQSTWTTLYRTTLPNLARESHSKSSASSPSRRWPVSLDHCFARIILDNAVGITQPWAEAVKAPATKNMSEEQLQNAIDLGQRIADGKEDLWKLDERSLELRGKAKKGGSKRKRDADEGAEEDETKKEHKVALPPSPPLSDTQASPPPPKQPRTRKGEVAAIWSTFSPLSNAKNQQSSADEAKALAGARQMIASDATLKPFRKHVLTLLTQVPKGQYTTYQALSDAAVRLDPAPPAHAKAEVSTKAKDGKAEKVIRGNARAIGGAMRNNPFAPVVPCHRVLASDGKLGGFGGDWGEEGRFAGEKKRLLREEGVKFDGKGKVVGAPWRGFWDYRTEEVTS